MCEQTEINYLDGEVVWVKLGSCWWPGEVVALEKLPPDVVRSFRKPPIAVVKFFQEDTYEYVKNINSIYKYNCSRKNEFINKGLYMFRTKHGHMEKFPEDVIRAETAVGGDIEILTRDEFQETKKESYAGLFGDPKKTPVPTAKRGRGRQARLTESPRISTPTRKVKEKTDYKVHILVQGSSTPSSQPTEVSPNPSTSNADSEPLEDKNDNTEISENDSKPDTPENTQNGNKVSSSFSTPTVSSSGIYSCHACAFSTSRLNVLILHNKSHSVTFMPYTPSPMKKKPTKSPAKSSTSSTKTPKSSRPRKEKTDKPPKKTSQAQKRASEEPKTITEVKKPKTEQEIKSSLLADWDDVDDDSNGESPAMIMAGSPEVAVAAESPAVPTPAELPSAQLPGEIPSPVEKKLDDLPPSEKPESTSDSKYEFCEDEDWPLEADVGRKIPRVKNPKRKDETKSVSLDDDEMAREVAELLTKTTVPELPSVPESLKVEENFPEPSVVKSPDKEKKSPELTKSPDKISETPPTKAIFKTKTFFRSRHSRSQDAIGKYVAEQLNIVERMDMSESEINGSDAVSSPEARESPPIEHVKVARLAPKIQLKKMKAEAAHLRDIDKDYGFLHDDPFAPKHTSPSLQAVEPTSDNQTLESSVKPESPRLDTSTETVNPVEETVVKPASPILEPASLTEETTHETASSALESMFKPESPPPDNTRMSSCESFESTFENASPTLENNIMLDKTDSDTSKENNNKVISSDVLQDVLYPTQEIKPVNEELPDESNAAFMKENINSSNNIEDVLESNSIEIAVAINKVSEPDLKENIEVHKETPSNLDIRESDAEKESVKSVEPYMNESTASAVDALLSVSRETDRVTRVISDDPPEDLFEDDNKDNVTCNINGFSNEVIPEEFIDRTPEIQHKEKYLEGYSNENGLFEDKPLECESKCEEKVEINQFITTEYNSDSKHLETPTQQADLTPTALTEHCPTESDLQIAEALINLPATAIQNNSSDNYEAVEVSMPLETIVAAETEVVAETESMDIDSKIIDSKEDSKIHETEPPAKSLQDSSSDNVRFETDLEKSENLNAAQSLVQMSESIDHKISLSETNIPNNSKSIPESEAFSVKKNNGVDSNISVEQKVASLSNDNSNEPSKPAKYETTCSKLLKILEEPCTPKITKTTPTKQIILPGKEKILNFDVSKSSFKPKTQPKSPVIIRRAATNKNLINNVTEKNTPEKIILSRTNKPSQDGSSVQTYTIQTSPDTPSDPNTITIIQQKVRKIAKPAAKLQKIKPQNSLVTPMKDIKTTKETTVVEDAMFDINSMPIVLSDDILTPESIEKMPIVMTDGNIGNVITNTSHPPKLVKTKQPIIEPEKPTTSTAAHKPEMKTLLMNPITEGNKIATPNILSKSSKLRAAKPMLVIDKATGKQKIIMTKAEPTVTKEIKPAPTLIQSVPQNSGKAEKFIILPTASSPRPGRTQKIVIDPQTGKAHVLVTKGPDSGLGMNDNKPVSAKLIPSSSDAASPGNTVMVITNAQGAQSRIVLTSEHEKILFPNKQQPNVAQLKTITQRIAAAGTPQKTIVNAVPQVKTQTRIVPKQKSAIITSKGQLIVGGRVATTAQNIAPMPEIRPVQKRIIAAEPKKLVQTIQKTNAEPLIFLQQKSGTVVQLTASQFEHFQRTGQIIQKIPAQESKPVVQKTITISPAEPLGGGAQKPRMRKSALEAPPPVKKVKHEVGIAPLPALTPLAPAPACPDLERLERLERLDRLDRLEETLPAAAIARPPDPAPLADQLLAVPGEPFGGPPGSFYLCVEDAGTLTPIDNRPLVLENNQLVPMAAEPPPPPPERRDILEAALANSDVFHAEPPRDDAPDFRDLNANVSVHCCVSETSTTLHQPIMTPVEVPSKADGEPAAPPTLEAIGVTSHAVPTSLELPITVTDPRLAARALHMPLLTEEPAGKSMPSLDERAAAGAEPWPAAGGDLSPRS